MHWWYPAVESRAIVQDNFVEPKDKNRKWKKFKISFFNSSRNVSQEVLLKDIFGVGWRYGKSTVLTRFNNVAVFIKFFRKCKSKKSTEWSLNCLFLLFKIQWKCDYYECVEISRIYVKNCIEDINGLNIEDMLYNQTE